MGFRPNLQQEGKGKESEFLQQSSLSECLPQNTEVQSPKMILTTSPNPDLNPNVNLTNLVIDSDGIAHFVICSI
jgi:hypothetical protein